MTLHATQAAAIIANKAPGFRPELGIVLGSGLGHLANLITNPITISYKELPGFPACSVQGHSGKLHLGTLEGVNVACLQGRAHFYEGISNDEAKTLIRTLKLLGCSTLLGTNSSGSLRADVPPGSLVLIKDHINMQFTNPLVGPNDDDFGPRFIGMEDAYNPQIRRQLSAIAHQLNIPITEGTYIAVLGPSFETPAEIHAFRTLGADVVGMSTINEVITARHCGMRVAVISVITNLAAGMSDEVLSHEGTLSGAKLAEKNLMQLVLGFIKQYQPVEAA